MGSRANWTVPVCDNPGNFPKSCLLVGWVVFASKSIAFLNGLILSGLSVLKNEKISFLSTDNPDNKVARVADVSIERKSIPVMFENHEWL